MGGTDDTNHHLKCISCNVSIWDTNLPKTEQNQCINIPTLKYSTVGHASFIAIWQGLWITIPSFGRRLRKNKRPSPLDCSVSRYKSSRDNTVLKTNSAWVMWKNLALKCFHWRDYVSISKSTSKQRADYASSLKLYSDSQVHSSSVLSFSPYTLCIQGDTEPSKKKELEELTA